MLAVVGSNGSGKSTLVRLANGLLLPNTGHVDVDGIVTSDYDRRMDVRTSVGVVFQRPDDQIVATSVRDDVAFGPENLGLPRDAIASRVADAIEAVGLTGLEEREPNLLSGGQKQRLAIAGVLAMRSRHIVLDEPTSMIDPVGRSEVLTLIQRLRDDGHAILHVTHDLSEAMRADRIIVLDGGSVVLEATPSQIASNYGELPKWGIEPTPLMQVIDAMSNLGALSSLTSASPREVAEALWP